MKFQLVTKEERWNLFTWLVFLLLFGGYFVALGLLALPTGLTGWGLCMLGVGPGSIGEAVGSDLRFHARRGSATITAVMALCFIFMFPIIVALLPTLATLLYLMDRADRRRKRRRNP